MQKKYNISTVEKRYMKQIFINTMHKIKCEETLINKIIKNLVQQNVIKDQQKFTFRTLKRNKFVKLKLKGHITILRAKVCL